MHVFTEHKLAVTLIFLAGVVLAPKVRSLPVLDKLPSL